MRLDCGLMLVLVATLMTNCRSRPEASRTDTATDKAASINGRIAVFNIYDKATQLTRQAPGTMVSSRAALIPGLKSTETVSLADDKRKGEKYIPLNTAKDSVVFVGLEPRIPTADSKSDAKKTDFNLLPTTETTLPPLSAQTLEPLEVQPRLVKHRTSIILYNDIGYIFAYASPIIADGGVYIFDDYFDGWKKPNTYREGEGMLETLYRILGERDDYKTRPKVPQQAVADFFKKGGFILSREHPFADAEGIGNIYWPEKPIGDKRPPSIDIIAYIGEDPLFELSDKLEIARKDLLPEAIGAAVNATSAKMNVPRDVERVILKYLDCDIK